VTGDRFPMHTTGTAPEHARGWLEAMVQRFGFLPSPGAKLAESPLLLDTFMRANGAFDTTGFAEVEQKVIVLTIAREFECGYSVAMHSAIMAGRGMPAELIAAVRAGAAPADPRLALLREFTLAVIRTRGQVPAELLDRFLAEGFTRANALEVVMAVGVFTMSTFANRLTEVPLDPPFQAHRWDPAAP
jgi:alkylhydroperoxidase family enzyme